MIWESDKDMIKKCLQLTLKSGTGGILDEIFYEWKSLLSRFESQVDEYIYKIISQAMLLEGMFTFYEAHTHIHAHIHKNTHS